MRSVPSKVCRSAVGTLAILTLLVGAAERRGQAQQPASPTQAPGLDPDSQNRIRDLKRQAREAHDKHDQANEKALYERILDIDPDDPLANDRVRQIEEDAAKKAKDAADARARDADLNARIAKIDSLITSALSKVARTLTAHDATLLDSAESDLTSAEALQPNPKQQQDIKRTEDSIARKRSFIRARFWELWGGVGAVVCLGLGLAVWSIWRKSRALEVVEGPDMGQTFVLKKDRTSLGALASEVDWALPDPMRKVSRHHCDVVRTGRHYFVVDRSTNGTQLNGQLLPPGEPVLLRRGDQIGLGGEVVVRFR